MATWQTASVTKCPSADIAVTNRVAVPEGFFPADTKHVVVTPGHGGEFHFTITVSSAVKVGSIGFTTPQRKWMQVATSEKINVKPLAQAPNYAGKIEVEIDFLKASQRTRDRFDSDVMGQQFRDVFNNSVITIGQQLAFEAKFGKKSIMFVLMVKGMESSDLAAVAAGKTDGGAGKPVNVALLFGQTAVQFSPVEGSDISLSGKSTGGGGARNIINPDWNFEAMGIGGLNDEFSTMFRRAFASRIMPVEFMERMGMQHVKGILLYGPPGTGKTLMARQIGKMLNGNEPKIVSGPEVLSKFVGQSEENVRALFEDAEAEYKKRGDHSGLHIIIFDEIDAICKARGTHSGGTGVNDSIVNQLLAKIDGVEALNNILLIGMTNRLDMIDEALLRPGRLELKMPIGLPDESGRKDILHIHTKKMRDADALGADVDFAELASLTKNFSGAELAGLSRSATSFAMNRCVSTDGSVKINEEVMNSLKVDRADFLNAMDEVIPAFGVSQEEFDGCILNGIVNWGDCVTRVLSDGELFCKQVRSSDRTPLVSVLLEGAPGAGKTALAAKLATGSDFPLIKLISPDSMVGYTEMAKVGKIKKVFEDAYKSQLSVIVVDNIERLLDYVPVGQRFSNTVLQTLLVLLKKRPPPGRKLLIIGTSSSKAVLNMMGVLDAFSTTLHVDAVTEGEQILRVVKSVDGFTPEEMTDIEKALASGNTIVDPVLGEASICVGVKKLYMLIEMARQEVDGRAAKFIFSLFEECRSQGPGVM